MAHESRHFNQFIAGYAQRTDGSWEGNLYLSDHNNSINVNAPFYGNCIVSVYACVWEYWRIKAAIPKWSPFIQAFQVIFWVLLAQYIQMDMRCCLYISFCANKNMLFLIVANISHSELAEKYISTTAWETEKEIEERFCSPRNSQKTMAKFYDNSSSRYIWKFDKAYLISTSFQFAYDKSRGFVMFAIQSINGIWRCERIHVRITIQRCRKKKSKFSWILDKLDSRNWQFLNCPSIYCHSDRVYSGNTHTDTRGLLLHQLDTSETCLALAKNSRAIDVRMLGSISVDIVDFEFSHLLCIWHNLSQTHK